MEEIGRYTLIGDLNDEVTKVKIAYDKLMHETVACKVFSRKDTNFLSVEEEIRVQERMNHPNIAPVKDVVYSSENIYVVMKYYPQGDLMSLLQGHVLGLRESIRIFIQIVDAVSYIHSHGVAHLDIKPENIFIDENYNAILADFGCCETAEARKRPYIPRGTFLYAAPESFMEENIDHRPVDIWSLGILLYLLITKRLPWKDGSDDMIQQQVIDGDIVQPNDDLGPFSEIISKCCKKNPKERITIDEMSDLVHSFVPCGDVNCTIKYRSSDGEVRRRIKSVVVEPRVIQSVFSFNSKFKIRNNISSLRIPIVGKSSIKYFM